MRLDLDGEVDIRARAPDEASAREHAARQTVEPGRGEIERADDLRDCACAMPSVGREVDRAVRVAELPGTGSLKDAPGSLIQPRGEPAQLGGEGERAARNLAEGAGAQDDALRDVLSVDEKNRYACVVIASGIEIGLGDRRRAQRALHIEVGDRKPKLVFDRARRKAAGRLIDHPIEGEIAVMIGEA